MEKQSIELRLLALEEKNTRLEEEFERTKTQEQTFRLELKISKAREHIYRQELERTKAQEQLYRQELEISKALEQTFRRDMEGKMGLLEEKVKLLDYQLDYHVSGCVRYCGVAVADSSVVVCEEVPMFLNHSTEVVTEEVIDDIPQEGSSSAMVVTTTTTTRNYGDKPHTCEQCEKSFTIRQNLTHHICTHTGEKPCKCKLCEKSFSQSSHLKRHLLTHIREKPHSCKLCGKSFARSVFLSVIFCTPQRRSLSNVDNV